MKTWGSRLGLGGLATVVMVLVCSAVVMATPATDPFALTAVQLTELTAADGGTNEFFGASVVLAGDTAFVSAPYHAGGYGLGAGAVYVFERAGVSWEQVARLTAGDGAADDDFGNSVACSGTTVVIGAPDHDVAGRADQGAAYVFTRTDQGWVQRAELNASDGAAGDLFGFWVDVDGDTVLAGALHADVAGTQSGAAYVFTRSGAVWTQQARLTAADRAAGDDFGAPVIIQGDLALIGACAKDVGANVGQGAAYAFARSGTAWSQQAKLDGRGGRGRRAPRHPHGPLWDRRRSSVRPGVM